MTRSSFLTKREWCPVLIRALADICLRRYIEKTCQGHGELSLKIQFHNFNLQELSEADINTISTLKAQGHRIFKNNTAKRPSTSGST
jgi:hypothetical protein